MLGCDSISNTDTHKHTVSQSPGFPTYSRRPRAGCLVTRYSSSLGSLSWSLDDSCCVVSFFTEFSSSTRPLFTSTEGGSRSSGGERGLVRDVKIKKGNKENMMCFGLQRHQLTESEREEKIKKHEGWSENESWIHLEAAQHKSYRNRI